MRYPSPTIRRRRPPPRLVGRHCSPLRSGGRPRSPPPHPSSGRHSYTRVIFVAPIEWCTHTMVMTPPYMLWCIVLYLFTFCICCHSLHEGNSRDIKVLKVGEELERETIPLKMGERIYQMHGLEESVWYEVKISYPASIPASFSIQLKRNAPHLWAYKNRRLLNTEKAIFKYDSQIMNPEQSEMYAVVTVDAEGVVAKPQVKEREVVLFNIVCDRLSFGIPYRAWCVGIAAILCLALASVIPYFLPSLMMPRNQGSGSGDASVMKSS